MPSETKAVGAQVAGCAATPSWVSPCGHAVLFCGDCRDTLPLLDGIADVMHTDPPYAIDARLGSHAGNSGTRVLQWDWDGPDTRGDVCERLAAAAAVLPDRTASVVWTGADSWRAYTEPFRAEGFSIRPLAWVKKCPPPAGKGVRWPSGFELGFAAWRRPVFFGDTDKSRSNVFVADSMRHGQPGKCGHPTQKPLSLTERHVIAIAAPKAVVLDPFMGSGTTGVAAIRHGRQFVGCEIRDEFFDMARRRIETECSRFPLFSSITNGAE